MEEKNRVQEEILYYVVVVVVIHNSAPGFHHSCQKWGNDV